VVLDGAEPAPTEHMRVEGAPTLTASHVRACLAYATAVLKGEKLFRLAAA